MPKGDRNVKWWIIFVPDHGMGVAPRDIGPFPYRDWALGWAFMELASMPMSWWYVTSRKPERRKD